MLWFNPNFLNPNYPTSNEVDIANLRPKRLPKKEYRDNKRKQEVILTSKKHELGKPKTSQWITPKKLAPEASTWLTNEC